MSLVVTAMHMPGISRPFTATASAVRQRRHRNELRLFLVNDLLDDFLDDRLDDLFAAIALSVGSGLELGKFIRYGRSNWLGVFFGLLFSNRLGSHFNRCRRFRLRLDLRLCG